MTHDDVQTWLDRYAGAWESYDPEAIGDLFSRDASYRYHPWDPPVQGREAIVRSWLEPEGAGSQRDTPGTYEGRYSPFAVDGQRAVGTGVSRYWSDAGRAQLRAVYHNTFLLEFDADARCRSFSEIYTREPQVPGGEPAG